MKALVGYTGFVGSNIYANATDIDAVFNSKNISEAYGLSPDLLIYAGLRAEKFLANNDPEADMKLILEAEENIEKIAPRKLVLISTIDVYKDPNGVDENTLIDTSGLSAYGYNRYMLEEWVREHYSDSLIIRLPALFGNNIKKNFIYDFINLIPSMLSSSKFDELSKADESLNGYYALQPNGFYKLNSDIEDRDALKQKFIDIDFTALNFTDSRSRYQFYDLSRLWDDIQILLKNKIKLWNAAVAPVTAAEVYIFITGDPFVNELSGVPADYDYRSIHAELFGGHDGYIYKKEEELNRIKGFVQDYKQVYK